MQNTRPNAPHAFTAAEWFGFFGTKPSDDRSNRARARDRSTHISTPGIVDFRLGGFRRLSTCACLLRCGFAFPYYELLHYGGSKRLYTLHETYNETQRKRERGGDSACNRTESGGGKAFVYEVRWYLPPNQPTHLSFTKQPSSSSGK